MEDRRTLSRRRRASMRRGRRRRWQVQGRMTSGWG
jgi:hypothetical protein